VGRVRVGGGVRYAEGREGVVVMVRVAPGRRFPRAQGNAVVQSPLLETKSRPGGVGSDTVTPVATEGPWFLTVTVKARFEPATARFGPSLVTESSTCVVPVDTPA